VFLDGEAILLQLQVADLALELLLLNSVAVDQSFLLLSEVGKVCFCLKLEFSNLDLQRAVLLASCFVLIDVRLDFLLNDGEVGAKGFVLLLQQSELGSGIAVELV
jgi:hypothetical protein